MHKVIAANPASDSRFKYIVTKSEKFDIIATQVAVVNPEGLNVSTAFPLREQNNGTSVT